MLRILHSLPRAHKLLLLPVATMVTVLGAQKLFTTYQSLHAPHTPVESVFVPLPSDASPGVPSLQEERTPMASAIDKASRALNATRYHMPLSHLPAMEVIDLDRAHDTQATAPTGSPLSSATGTGYRSDTAFSDDPTQGRALDNSARHIAVVLGTLSSGMLDAHDTVDVDIADATSYENYDIDLADDAFHSDAELAMEETYVPEWKTHIVAPGDTFAVLGQKRFGLGYSDVLTLLDALPDDRLLTHWRAGHSFDYQLDKDNRLLALRIMQDARKGIMVERKDTQYTVTPIERRGEPVQRLYAGNIRGSFARSAQATGLDSAAVTELTRLLAKKLDFRRDSRRGDAFQVLVESDMIEGEVLDSRILAVRYEGERMQLTAIRHATDNRFYTAEGRSLDPAFARYPFEGHYRLSSNFNPRRKHPVTGRISPHNGTDFAMPVGSPITAPASGRVERVDTHYAAGRYVVIRHDNGYRTRYLHLSKPLVKRGQRVEIGERIALSGNSGRSTGPHLHYEVHVNNTPVNAMQIDLPENTRLNGDMLLAFQRQAAPLLAALESGETGTISIASYTQDSTDNDN